MTKMAVAARALDITRELALVLPRAVSGISESTDWLPISPAAYASSAKFYLTSSC
ncbi:hypothetical protein I552_0849 [Mycobacterium xenopi 3993]|nr:hypothetical protein I552_0849 [Mycobacterium xenopi 3993]